MIDFATQPDRYRHWRLSVADTIATLVMDVDEHGGLHSDYELKLNSYDLAVDIELYDAIQRLRFQHPSVRVVILTSAKEKVFCAGANIRMLNQSSHGHKVNFCKFTNETRNAMEDASAHSGQKYLSALNGAAAGGGYELALACDYILLVDDGSSAVSLPEVPLLAVLPGTGGLTRLVDKRKVRHDHADFFCTTEEGIRGKRAVQWRLVDAVVPSSKFSQAVKAQAQAMVAQSDRPTATEGKGIELTPLERSLSDAAIDYRYLSVSLDRTLACATITLRGPAAPAPETVAEVVELGDRFWPLALARELDDLILHLRFNEPEIGTWVFKSQGDATLVSDYDQLLANHQNHWLVREIILYWKRTLQRLEVSARSLMALVEPASCFAGTLLEIVLSADRSFMLDGQFEDDSTPAPIVRLSPLNFGLLSRVNSLTRLQSRFLDVSEHVLQLQEQIGQDLDAVAAEEQRLVTFIPDDIDWQDEVRIALQERASFSPDALSGMEASLRFAGPETLESKIFSRLSAWQNWIFQRPNAVGEQGALQRYGSGRRAEFDNNRV